MIIFYWDHARLIFTRVIALWQFFNSKSCLCNSSCSIQWILVKPSSYCCHDLKRIILYQGHAWLTLVKSSSYCCHDLKRIILYWGHAWLLLIRSSCLHNSSYISQRILMKLSSYCFHDLKMIIFYWGHAKLKFLPELWSFGNFLTVSLVSATPLAVFSGF